MLTDRQLFLQYLGQTSPYPIMLEIVKAEGSFLFGPSGEKYLDLVSGVSVSNTGHRHPEVVQAVSTQLQKYMHLMVYGEFIQSPQVKYAARLSELLPPQLEQCYFVSSGSEAVEGALKLARKKTGRSRIVSFKNSYHGSTLGALSIQGGEKYKSPFRPLLPDVLQIPFNDPASPGIIDERTACAVVEPIQAEAGVIYPENDFLKDLRTRCDQTGTLLIFDEIQTGFGRCGYLFAFEKFGVVPDILLLAKALGGGMPLGAFISSSGIMSALTENPSLSHITTFGGHPVCCAAGLASLNVILKENLVAEAVNRNTLFKEKLRHDLIVGIRGEGLLLAVQLADPAYVRHVINQAPDFGLVLDYFLFCESAFRITPPLTINEEETEYAIVQLKRLLDDAEASVKR
jgi:acetylornithine/succinyldiaminopimelate/putrescine aminotransferase